jgi:hypothetical protein
MLHRCQLLIFVGALVTLATVVSGKSIDLSDNIDKTEHLLDTLKQLDRAIKEEEAPAEDKANKPCSKDCKNLDPRCNKNPGLPPITCSFWDKPDFADTTEICPKMCKKCTPCKRENLLSDLLDLLED